MDGRPTEDIGYPGAAGETDGRSGPPGHWLARYRADHADGWNAAIHHVAQPLLVFWAMGLADRAALAGPLWVALLAGWLLLDVRAGAVTAGFALLAWGAVGLLPAQAVGVAGLLGWGGELVGHGLVERAWPRPFHALVYIGVGPVNTAACALERFGLTRP